MKEKKVVLTLLLLVIVAILCVTLTDGKGTLEYTVNVKNITGEWNHFWERCVGSGHAALALRDDYQRQMRKTREDLGFQQVRFHGIFVDDMSVVLPNITGGPGVNYSFFNVDRIYDFLVSIGMKPYVEISFMPKLLASGNATWSHYNAFITPPKTWDSWVYLVQNFTSHLIDRYGLEEVLTWNFEVWNEPNCCPHDFWTGSQYDYFVLFNYTSRAVKSVHPKLRVGGPTTAMSAWIPEFLSFCRQNSVPFDFIDTHEYPTDPPGPQSREFFAARLKKTRSLVGENLPLYYTEYDDGYNSDGSYASSFITYTVFSVSNYVDILSWWPFSDIFEEQGLYPQPFNPECAGLLNLYGIPKPSYRAFQLLHWTGNKVIDVSPGPEYYKTVSTFGVVGNKTRVFVVNWDVKPNTGIETERVRVLLEGVSRGDLGKIEMWRVDEEHGNAKKEWEKMGRPMYLSSGQVEQLMKKSEIEPVYVEYEVDEQSGQIALEFDVPPYGIVNLVF